MILYPTETIYALGVTALDEAEIAKLFQLKGRAEGKGVSWLVRDTSDIAQYGEFSPVAAEIAQQFLPGSLTLVLRARDIVPRPLRGPDDTVSFRISPDPVAQQVIADFMAEHNAPLTCTSANVSGRPTMETPDAILDQFEQHYQNTPFKWSIDKVIDDGPRSGDSSTVVRIIGDQIHLLREGAIPTEDIMKLKYSP